MKDEEEDSEEGEEEEDEDKIKNAKDDIVKKSKEMKDFALEEAKAELAAAWTKLNNDIEGVVKDKADEINKEDPCVELLFFNATVSRGLQL